MFSKHTERWQKTHTSRNSKWSQPTAKTKLQWTPACQARNMQEGPTVLKAPAKTQQAQAAQADPTRLATSWESGRFPPNSRGLDTAQRVRSRRREKKEEEVPKAIRPWHTIPHGATRRGTLGEPPPPRTSDNQIQWAQKKEREAEEKWGETQGGNRTASGWREGMTLLPGSPICDYIGGIYLVVFFFLFPHSISLGVKVTDDDWNFLGLKFKEICLI